MPNGMSLEPKNLADEIAGQGWLNLRMAVVEDRDGEEEKKDIKGKGRRRKGMGTGEEGMKWRRRKEMWRKR